MCKYPTTMKYFIKNVKHSKATRVRHSIQVLFIFTIVQFTYYYNYQPYYALGNTYHSLRNVLANYYCELNLIMLKSRLRKRMSQEQGPSQKAFGTCPAPLIKLAQLNRQFHLHMKLKSQLASDQLFVTAPRQVILPGMRLHCRMLVCK